MQELYNYYKDNKKWDTSILILKQNLEDGFSDYRGECDKMRIVGVKAKLGTCYKCVPVIRAESEEVSEDSDEPLPFEYCFM